MKIDKEDIKNRTKGTLIEVLGMQFIETNENDTLEASMHITNIHTQIMGVVHGGATIALAETLAGVASNEICEDDEQCLGIQISASHVSTGKLGDTLKAYAQIQHKGRTLHIWNVDIYSEKTGKLVSTIKVTNAVVKRRPFEQK